MSGKTFLLVEDDKNDMKLMEEQIKASSESIRVQWVSDGAEAVRYLKGEVEYSDRGRFPVPDVILLDLKMPRFSGFDFLEWLHHGSPQYQRLIPVVVISSSNEPSDVLRAYALGANCYVVKPLAWREFKDRVRALAVFWGGHTETPNLPSPKEAFSSTALAATSVRGTEDFTH